MKAKKSIFILGMILFLSSCIPTHFYQVYDVKPGSNIALESNLLAYDDQNCKVTYNLWRDNGNIGFSFFNKTDNDIYLNLEKSFFILNGLAYQYYQNRTYTSSKSIGASTSSSFMGSKEVTGINYLNFFQTNKLAATNAVVAASSEEYSISYVEQNIITIPSKTAIIVSEFSINDMRITNCDLFRYPTRKQIKSTSFNESDSPIMFSNRISYSLENSTDLIKFENSFYVEEITNYPEGEMYEFEYEERCGQKSATQTRYFKEYSPDKFYLKYTKGTDTWEH